MTNSASKTSTTCTSPCWSCTRHTCVGCKRELMRNWVTQKENLPPASELDNFIERLYREITDFSFDENDDGTLVLGQPFHGFPVGEFSQDDWFSFIDEHHSKGMGWVYENISPYDTTGGTPIKFYTRFESTNPKNYRILTESEYKSRPYCEVNYPRLKSRACKVRS